jgi:hypothetical protein
MRNDIDERPVWDETLAKHVVGKVVLVGAADAGMPAAAGEQ